jgi:hypothetical protein
MTQPNTISIDNVQYVRADAKPTMSDDIKIVVLINSHVFVGYFSIIDGFVIVEKAKQIRYWGTTKGLGELLAGPTPKTILDDAGVVKAPLASLIFTLNTVVGKWSL